MIDVIINSLILIKLLRLYMNEKVFLMNYKYMKIYNKLRYYKIYFCKTCRSDTLFVSWGYDLPFVCQICGICNISSPNYCDKKKENIKKLNY